MVGTIQEAIEVKRRPTDEHEGLTEWQREDLREAARLNIPMQSAYNLRRYAEILRAVADFMDTESRRTDIDAYDVLSRVRSRVKEARYNIDKIAKPRKNT